MDTEKLKKLVAQGFNDKKILVVGDVMLDRYYFGEVTRISPEAPVPIVNIQNITETLGGAANVAHNLSLLGCQPFLISQIGKDEYGNVLLKKLNTLGIDSSGIVRTSKPTTTKVRIVATQQQMLRLDFEDSTKVDDLTSSNLFERFQERLEYVNAVIISDYNKGVCTENFCRKLIKKCQETQTVIVIDPKGNDWQKYFGANFITPNLKELGDVSSRKILNDDKEIEITARKVITMLNLDGMIITRSAKGLTILDSEMTSHIRAVTQEVCDVSGAGDTVAAVFSLVLTNNFDLISAAYLANLAAGFVVTKSGTYAISQSELLKIL